MIIWPAKDPGATENFAFDFTDALNGATISGIPTVTSADVTVAGINVDGAFVRFRLSAGTAGTVAKVNCLATLSNGEILPELGVLPIGGEAVSLATAKAEQKIDGDSEDALLAGDLRAAISHVEKTTGKNLTAKIESQTVHGFPARCSAFGAIRLWKGPVSEILSVKYDDGDGVEQTLTSFRLVEGGDAGSARLLPAYGASWPSTAVGPGTVRVTYIAGYDPAELPADLTLAVLLLFGHWNANREATTASDRSAAVELPFGVERLIAPFRVPGIA
jgi:uncharacterized phiE125 gp8 family phage protein